jgi:hypothetical protein
VSRVVAGLARPATPTQTRATHTTVAVWVPAPRAPQQRNRTVLPVCGVSTDPTVPCAISS